MLSPFRATSLKSKLPPLIAAHHPLPLQAHLQAPVQVHQAPLQAAHQALHPAHHPAQAHPLALQAQMRNLHRDGIQEQIAPILIGVVLNQALSLTLPMTLLAMAGMTLLTGALPSLLVLNPQ